MHTIFEGMNKRSIALRTAIYADDRQKHGFISFVYANPKEQGKLEELKKVAGKKGLRMKLSPAQPAHVRRYDRFVEMMGGEGIGTLSALRGLGERKQPVNHIGRTLMAVMVEGEGIMTEGRLEEIFQVATRHSRAILGNPSAVKALLMEQVRKYGPPAGAKWN